MQQQRYITEMVLEGQEGHASFQFKGIQKTHCIDIKCNKTY